MAFLPFKSALEALQQINAISDGLATDELLNFLELNLPKASTHTHMDTHMHERTRTRTHRHTHGHACMLAPVCAA